MFLPGLYTRCGCAGLLLCVAPAAVIATAQQTNVSNVKIPTLVNFSGSLVGADGKPLTRITSIRFALYPEQEGGQALWTETQNVTPDAAGHYSTMLGATTEGLPAELFTSGNARWLGLQVEGKQEEPRIMLVSVPYALKAGDAQTIGGMPPSAFALAGSTTSTSQANSGSAGTSPKAATTPVPALSGTGKTGYIPEWLSSSTLGSSALFQSSSGSVGIATTSPTQKFEVDSGNLLVRGANNFQKTGNTAALYLGDSSHLIQSIYGSGIAMGTYKVPEAIFIQDTTGSVGIGTTSPTGTLDVVGKSTAPIITVKQSGTGNGITASAANSSCDKEPCAAGVYGTTTSEVDDAGVLGVAYGRSTTGLNINNGAGVWGDTSAPQSGAIAVLGTTDDNSAITAINNGMDAATLSAYNQTSETGATVLYAAGGQDDNGYCYVDTSGDLACSGSKSAVVTLNNQHKVALYAVEAPENWFEDFGTGQLVAGSAVVSLDPKFTQAVNTTTDYHVFLTPRGDCKGLYFSQQSATSFVVREIGAGTSNVQFDYRIVARRKGYENIRLADMTERVNRLRQSRPGMTPVRQGRGAAPQLSQK